MTDEQNYTRIAELAIGITKMITDRKHIAYSWAPLQLLYVEMTKRKEINSLKEIGDKALKYWTEACLLRPDGAKHLKVWITQALYTYDLIIKSEKYE